MLTRKVSYYLHSTTHMQHATHLAQMCKIQQINCAIYFEKYLSPYVEERKECIMLDYVTTTTCVFLYSHLSNGSIQ